MVIDMDGPPCQGNCPNRGCVEAFASGTALAREARRIAGDRPESGLARALRDGRELAGPLVTELAHDGDARGDRGDRADRLSAGGGDRQPGQHLQPGGGGDRRRGDRAPESCCWRRRGPRWPGARCRRRATWSRIVAARFGVEAGMIGAAALAFDGLAEAGGVSAAPRRLPDPDRQPRGRHPAGAGRPARGRPRRLRGHPAHPDPARPLRRRRASWSATTSTTSAPGPTSSWRGCRRARWWRWSPTPACRSSPTPGSCSCRPAWPPGSGSRCCPAPRRR